MNIGFHGREFSKSKSPFVQKIFDALQNYNAEIFISKSFFNVIKNSNINLPKPITIFSQEEPLSSIDFMFSIGGDGTLLETVTYVGLYQIPILGVNIGRLGFLATIQQDDIHQAIKALFEKKFNLDRRTLIKFEANAPVFEDINFALNEFTILKQDTSSMIVVHTYIDGEFLNSYWADGLIVATPTGSTGYSLSCGGPILTPNSNNFVITPVNPHNLNVRPIVVPDKSKISFKIEGRSKHFLVALDSRSKTVDSSIDITVRKQVFHANLVKVKNITFFDTLRQKLNWGLDIRN